MNDNIIPFLPKDGLFTKYIEFTGGGEICPRFRFFSFAAMLGSIIKRKVYFQRSTADVFPPLYPNLWLILVAPQGVGHKSSALRQARKFALRLDSTLKPRMLAAKLTPEALVKALSCPELTAQMLEGVGKDMVHIIKKTAQGLLFSSEFGVLLGKQKYNDGMIALLTDMYDCEDEWESETIMRGGMKLYEICISIMAASTPDWMQTMLPTDAFKGGFMSRMLLVGYPSNWNCRIADPPGADLKLRDEIQEGVEYLAKLKGEIKWTKEAKSTFIDWYHSVPDREPGPKSAYLERKQDHMLRLAIILQLAHNQSLTLERYSLEQSLSLLNSVEPDTLKMVEYISMEPKMRIVQRILELMEHDKVMTEADLLNGIWGYLQRASEFDEVMRMLLKTKKVTMDFKDGVTVYIYKDVKKKKHKKIHV